MSKQASIVVTGAAGFIGSHVSEALLRDGRHVVGVDNFDPYYDPVRKRENLEDVGKQGDFIFAESDIRDADRMRDLFASNQVTGVIHLAAKAGVRPSIEDPAGYSSVNVHGTSVLLEAAREAGVERFVMASSSSVYGNNDTVPFSEEHDVSHPISPYAATKAACELIAHTHQHLTGMPTACLRFFTVFGPRQRPDLAIGKFMRMISDGETIPMFGDGSTSRDYTFIDDIVRGVIASFDRIDRHGYRVWNLGGSSPVRLDEMIEAIGRVVGHEPVVDRQPMQAGDVERTFADLTRSRRELDFEPRTSFDEGLRRQWAWLSARSSRGVAPA